MVQPRKQYNTLEIIMILIIIGLMLMLAVPRFVDIKSDLRIATERGIVNSIRMGINKYKNEKKRFPTALDTAENGSCSMRNPCFSAVLASGGITGGWKKRGNTYISNQESRFTYHPSTGRFN